MRRRSTSALVLAAVCVLSGIAGAQSSETAFTYQGRLDFQGQPYSGDADYRFTLWNAEIGGGQVGNAVETLGVTVDEGLFSSRLDFGAAALVEQRWLQIEVRTPAWDGQGTEPAYTALDSRQPMTRSPYSVQTRGLIVNEAGDRVGIGADPAHPFHVSSPDFATTLIQSSSGIGTWLNLSNTSDGGVFWKLISTGADNGEGPGNLLLGSAPTARTIQTTLFFNPDGDIGIGTKAPQARVHNVGSYYGRGQLELHGFWGEGSNSDAAIVGVDHGSNPTDVGLRLYTTFSGTTVRRLAISAAGNIGVGADPLASDRFFVSGSSRFEGDMAVIGDTVFGGPNALISLGDSAEDTVFVPGALEFGDASRQKTAYIRPIVVDVPLGTFTIPPGTDYRFSWGPIQGTAAGMPLVVTPPVNLFDNNVIGFARMDSSRFIHFSLVNTGTVSRTYAAGNWRVTLFVP